MTIKFANVLQAILLTCETACCSDMTVPQKDGVCQYPDRILIVYCCHPGHLVIRSAMAGIVCAARSMQGRWEYAGVERVQNPGFSHEGTRYW